METISKLLLTFFMNSLWQVAIVAISALLCDLLYESIYIPISFHPAAALVKRRIDQTRELACDEMVAEQLVDASTYARALVDIADSMSTGGRPKYT